MAVTTATIVLWCNGNTADFGSVIRGSSPRGTTKLTRHYESRHNTLFGRGMPETTQVLSFPRIRGIHDRPKTSFHRTSIQGGRV